MAMVKEHDVVPLLETPRLRLRGHRRDDFDAMAAMWADERVVRYISGKPSTRAQSWARLLQYIGHWQILSFGYWALEDRETGVFLGEVGLADFKRDITPSIEGIPEIGWVLVPDAHGKGLATEAVAAVLKWADAHFEQGQTVCLFHPQHGASIRVAEKNGYVWKADGDYMGAETLIMQRVREK
ncbi:RimJ/RimL family protein N-acetyltransferase [Agrobacterium vitis]|nr:RimJ/RimL family protein N-acetyltransferase [Agrobacterium vitis]MBE1438680.1 RimJ/RimL family protein N-acetyltransferase [Agrobacterium vitis]